MKCSVLLSNNGVNRLKFYFLCVLGLLFSGCANQENSRPPLTGSQLMERMGLGWNPIILDVRSQLEYNAGHVPGARHVSFWVPWLSRERIPADPDRPVVVYCEHGPRAYLAGWGMRNAGFNQVIYLQGHMSQWRKDGLRIEKPAP